MVSLSLIIQLTLTSIMCACLQIGSMEQQTDFAAKIVTKQKNGRKKKLSWLCLYDVHNVHTWMHESGLCEKLSAAAEKRIQECQCEIWAEFIISINL